MSTALTVRTPELIAAEINNIKNQTRTMVLYNSIEIGRRLCEAKECMPHGEWGNWLETSVDYSKSTANNLMRIFTEYGADQIALFGETGAKSQALGDLTYTQAVLMLGMPDIEREEFLKENDIDNMSTRELQQVIKERDEARKEKEEADKKLQEANKLAEIKADEVKNLQEKLVTAQQELDEAKASGDDDEVMRLQEKLDETDAQLENANLEISDLNNQLNAKPIEVTSAEVIEKIPDEVEKELNELRNKQNEVALVNYKNCFEEIVKDFNKLLTALDEVKQCNPEQAERYTHATLELISKMSARI